MKGMRFEKTCLLLVISTLTLIFGVKAKCASPGLASETQLSADEIEIERQAEKENLKKTSKVQRSYRQSTGTYGEVGAPRPAAGDRLSDSEYSKIQKIVNFEKVTQAPPKVKKPHLTQKQRDELKAEQLKAQRQQRKEELAAKQEIARKKKVKVNLTEVTSTRKPSRRKKTAQLAKYDSRLAEAESRQTARAARGLQQAIDPSL